MSASRAKPPASIPKSVKWPRLYACSAVARTSWAGTLVSRSIHRRWAMAAASSSAAGPAAPPIGGADDDVDWYDEDDEAENLEAMFRVFDDEEDAERLARGTSVGDGDGGVHLEPSPFHRMGTDTDGKPRRYPVDASGRHSRKVVAWLRFGADKAGLGEEVESAAMPPATSALADPVDLHAKVAERLFVSGGAPSSSATAAESHSMPQPTFGGGAEPSEAGGPGHVPPAPRRAGVSSGRGKSPVAPTPKWLARSDAVVKRAPRGRITQQELGQEVAKSRRSTSSAAADLHEPSRASTVEFLSVYEDKAALNVAVNGMHHNMGVGSKVWRNSRCARHSRLDVLRISI